ncbi:J domain-containing protein [Imhoffiella purpurea]|uniref:J domain-containing protein n=1 Tax=Imhoffiella purpurea TaxID=1249627 RepID=W9V2Y0_9GAMM|nr:J domain-containing protein [Imhoffiella purpurea]EXJ13699.1 hypothetical protein D779_3454 [Imhoffiella purpurea]
MSAHWTQEIADSLASGRPSNALEQHLDALLLWLGNPDNPGAAALDAALARNRLDRGRATTRAYRLLDRRLFPADQGPSAQTLGLGPDADPALAKQRYRRLIQVYHPDRHPNRTVWATQHTEQINRAYDSFRRPRTQGRRPSASATGTEGSRPETQAHSPQRRFGRDITWILSRIPGNAWNRLLGQPRMMYWAGGALALALLAAIGSSLLHEEPKPRPRIIHHPLGQTERKPPTTATGSREETAPNDPPQPTQPVVASNAIDSTPEPTGSRPTAAAATAADEPGTPITLSRRNEPSTDAREPAPEEEIEPQQDMAAADPAREPDAAIESTSSTTSQGAEDTAASTRFPEPSDPIQTHEAPTPEIEPPEPSAPIEPPEPEPSPIPAPQTASPAAESSAPRMPPEPDDRTPAPEPLPERQPPPRSESDSRPRIPQRLQPELQIPAIQAPKPPAQPTSPRQPLQLGVAPATIGSVPGSDPDATVCRQATALMQRFQQAYQSGSLDGLMALYSPLAKENDLGTWFAIRQTYRHWFASTRARRIDFEQLQVKPTANGGRCAAIAIFKVVYLDLDSKLAQRDGVIEVLLEPKGSDLRILRMRY